MNIDNIPEQLHNADVRKMSEAEMFDSWDHLEANGDDISEHYHHHWDGTIELDVPINEDRHIVIVRGDDVGPVPPISI